MPRWGTENVTACGSEAVIIHVPSTRLGTERVGSDQVARNKPCCHTDMNTDAECLVAVVLLQSPGP